MTRTHATTFIAIWTSLPGGAEALASPASLPRAPTIASTTLHDSRVCGVNTVYILARLAGAEPDYDTIRALPALNPEGLSLDEVARALRYFGVHASVRNLAWSDALLGLTPPYVVYGNAHIGDAKHYYIVLGVVPDKSELLVMDSTTGFSAPMTAEAMNRLWTGYTLVPEERPPDGPTVASALSTAIGLLCTAATTTALMPRLRRSCPTPGGLVSSKRQSPAVPL